MNHNPTTQQTFDTLGGLLLSSPSQSETFTRILDFVSRLDCEQLSDLFKKAETQRVLRRTIDVLRSNLRDCAGSKTHEILDSALAAERARSENALATLEKVVLEFEIRDLPVVVMKTLDHWPDTGSDLDLLVDAKDEDVCRMFEHTFRANQLPQSWGDRLAHKFNFRVPGLPELVEVHIACLGQTGEHRSLAQGVLARSRKEQFSLHTLPVPTAEDQVVIATLQRMYRHYYIRLTDIVNISRLLAANEVDFSVLQRIAEEAVVWPGVATLMTVACEHAALYGGPAIALPGDVLAAARFNAGRTYAGKNFLRIPLMPEAAELFLEEVAGKGRRHNFRAMARLSLLPLLASAAFVSFRVTGNDKGIW